MVNIEGTFQLEGILELTATSDESVLDKLNEWLKTLSAIGIIFSKDVDGKYITLLPETGTVKSEHISSDPAGTLCDLLNQLGDIYTCPISSTLRSKEILQGKEVQVIYANDDNNNFRKEERTLSCQTEKPPEPLSPKEMVKIALPILVLLVGIIGISTFWVDYKELFNKSKESITPVAYDKIEIVCEYDDVFTIEALTGKGRDFFALKIKRKSKGALDVVALSKQYSEAEELHKKLYLESLVRGYVRIELFGKGGFLHSAFIRIADLKDKDVIIYKMYYPNMKKVSKVVIRP